MKLWKLVAIGFVLGEFGVALGHHLGWGITKIFVFNLTSGVLAGTLLGNLEKQNDK